MVWSEHVAIHRYYRIHRLLLFFCNPLQIMPTCQLFSSFFLLFTFLFFQQPSDNFVRKERESSRIRLMDLLNIVVKPASLHSSDAPMLHQRVDNGCFHLQAFPCRSFWNPFNMCPNTDQDVTEAGLLLICFLFFCFELLLTYLLHSASCVTPFCEDAFL